MHFRETAERITMIVVALLATAVSLADIFGVLEAFHALHPVQEKIPVIVLLLLGLVSLYLVFERRGKLDKIETELLSLTSGLNNINLHISSCFDQIPNIALHGVEFFSTTDQILERMTEATIGAETVSTLNLSP